MDIHIASSIGTPSDFYTADEQEKNGARDYDITLTLDGAVIEGGVTLWRDANGVMATCGAPRDGWCSGDLIRAIASLGLSALDERAVYDEIAAGAGAETAATINVECAERLREGDDA